MKQVPASSGQLLKLSCVTGEGGRIYVAGRHCSVYGVLALFCMLTPVISQGSIEAPPSHAPRSSTEVIGLQISEKDFRPTIMDENLSVYQIGDLVELSPPVSAQTEEVVEQRRYASTDDQAHQSTDDSSGAVLDENLPEELNYYHVAFFVGLYLVALYYTAVFGAWFGELTAQWRIRRWRRKEEIYQKNRPEYIGGSYFHTTPHGWIRTSDEKALQDFGARMIELESCPEHLTVDEVSQGRKMSSKELKKQLKKLQVKHADRVRDFIAHNE